MSMIEAAEREQLLRIYAETRTIAVVGASADEAGEPARWRTLRRTGVPLAG